MEQSVAFELTMVCLVRNLQVVAIAVVVVVEVVGGGGLVFY